MSYKCTCFIKPDLDTVVTAFLLRHRGLGHICHLPTGAPDALLDDRHVLCIECGGSGRSADADFDHHGHSVLPCAAEQAWKHAGRPQTMRELVRYTACVDTGTPFGAGPGAEGGLTLSALFSGMRFCHTTPVAQFRAGLELLDDVLRHRLPPADVTPLVRRSPLAARYAAAKQAATGALEQQRGRARFFTIGPWAVGALVSTLPGVHGLLRRSGADISIAGSPGPGNNGFRWSISVRPGLECILARALQAFAAQEPGWGGPAGGGIICSPRSGSGLDLARVRSLLAPALCRPA